MYWSVFLVGFVPVVSVAHIVFISSSAKRVYALAENIRFNVSALLLLPACLHRWHLPVATLHSRVHMCLLFLF